MTYDLTKLEEKFWEFIKAYENYDKNEIRITEELITQEETLYIPFGHMKYFLVIEDEKPVIFAHAVSRMDLNSICFIDEMWEKYRSFRRNVKRSRGMKGLPKARE